MLKKLALIAALAVPALTLAACQPAAVVSENISKDADNFQTLRQIVLYNGITDAFIQEVQGYCSIQPGENFHIAVICKTDHGYIKDMWRIGDNTVVFVHQLDASNVSPNFYKVVLRPTTIIPDIVLR